MKKILCFLLTATLLMAFSVNAFAAEVPETEAGSTEAVDITESTATTEDVFTEEDSISPRAVTQSFTMTTSHRGGDRTYSNSTMLCKVLITDTNGNATNNRVKIALYDYNHSIPLDYFYAYADGSIYGHSFYVTPGTVYYLMYTTVSGTSQTLRVTANLS